MLESPLVGVTGSAGVWRRARVFSPAGGSPAVVFAAAGGVSTDMSQQHGFPPPPPPHNGSPSTGAAPYFTQQRRRTQAVQPPSISTTFHQTQGVGPQSQTPVTASTPFPHSPAVSVALSSRTTGSGFLEPGSALPPHHRAAGIPGSPSMAQQPYNPRQWSGHGNRMMFATQSSPLTRDTREVTGMEGM